MFCLFLSLIKEIIIRGQGLSFLAVGKIETDT